MVAAGLVVIGVLVAGVASATVDAPKPADTFYACMTRGGLINPLTIRKGEAPRSCPLRSDTIVSWTSGSGAGSVGPVGPVGPAGPQGPAGADGADGSQGPAGADGTDGANGRDGQDGVNGRDGVDGRDGTDGRDGEDGRDGSTILNGSGAPTADLGADGDFYLDTDTYQLYGPKAAGAWPATGVSLIGPQGPAGPTGPAGPEGPIGPVGPEGPSGGTTTTTTAPQPQLVDVVLIDGGGNKLEVVKVVKDLTGLGLKEAKDLVDAAPSTILTGVDRAQAEAARKALTEAGGEVQLR